MIGRNTSRPFVLTLATIALAWSTERYTRATRASLDEARLARAESSQPVLKLEPGLFGGVHPVARLTNVGRRPALKIRGQIVITVQGSVRRDYALRLAHLPVGLNLDFFIDVAEGETYDVRSVAAEARTFRIALDYDDAFGRQYETAQEADSRDVTEHLFGAQMVIPSDQLAEIARTLDKIEGVLRDIARKRGT